MITSSGSRCSCHSPPPAASHSPPSAAATCRASCCTSYCTSLPATGSKIRADRATSLPRPTSTETRPCACRVKHGVLARASSRVGTRRSTLPGRSPHRLRKLASAAVDASLPQSHSKSDGLRRGLPPSVHVSAAKPRGWLSSSAAVRRHVTSCSGVTSAKRPRPILMRESTALRSKTAPSAEELAAARRTGSVSRSLVRLHMSGVRCHASPASVSLSATTKRESRKWRTTRDDSNTTPSPTVAGSSARPSAYTALARACLSAALTSDRCTSSLSACGAGGKSTTSARRKPIAYSAVAGFACM
mmetsp:Transcript_3212/g.11421  ORF Transcript_3212/g.11421 Transcript_3212/m.11421 type:complete len:302 (+) Transcript_3212:766-1671(+)